MNNEPAEIETFDKQIESKDEIAASNEAKVSTKLSDMTIQQFKDCRFEQVE